MNVSLTCVVVVSDVETKRRAMTNAMSAEILTDSRHRPFDEISKTGQLRLVGENVEGRTHERPDKLANYPAHLPGSELPKPSKAIDEHCNQNPLAGSGAAKVP